MATGKQYSVWLANPRLELWNQLLLFISVPGTPITAMALGAWFEFLFGRTAGVIGIVAGISIWLGIYWWFGKKSGDVATAIVEADRLVVIKQQTTEGKEFLFSELAKYRVLINFRGRASLRLIAESGRRLTLGGAASPEFTALVGEFDVSTSQYERLSGKRFTRIDMGS